jgi:site-specific DNA-methyltransferase (adenine-specific)
MTGAIEDAGFEIRDCLSWQYGSGFPKSLSVEKNVPAEHAKRWAGWGTALKPAWEPIVVARRPLGGTVAGNVLKYGTGALNIDGCRVGTGGDKATGGCKGSTPLHGGGITARTPVNQTVARWPANVLLSCPPDCDGDTHAPGCPCAALDAQHNGASRYFNRLPIEEEDLVPFVYAAKASRSERNAGMPEGSTCTHPTVKPVSVMRHLTRLVVPPGGLVLDPFMGSGTTGIAAVREGFDFVGIEMNAEYLSIAEARIEHAKAKG